MDSKRLPEVTCFGNTAGLGCIDKHLGFPPLVKVSPGWAILPLGMHAYDAFYRSCHVRNLHQNFSGDVVTSIRFAESTFYECMGVSNRKTMGRGTV